MRFHVVSLAHTQTIKAYSHCAYTEKVRKFCDMMTSLGHEVFLYAGDENKANCTELITCITRKEQRDLIGIIEPTDNLKAKFIPSEPYWQIMNARAIAGIKQRIQKEDFICVIAGLCQKEIADAFPDHMTVEFGIGYSGTFAKYRVFESYAWMHTVYGMQQGADTANGNFYDAVIPNYWDPQDFPPQKNKDDYYLYIGRITDRKGYQIAVDVCKKLNKRLIIAGQGTPPEYGEYVGIVGPERRSELMGKAIAVFVPTIYVEPFGGVAVEAMMCGTPVITTDWGAFTETVRQGKTGYRCRTFKEFCEAAQKAPSLNSRKIRDYAIKNYSTKVVGLIYQKYFTRLLTLWEKGFYSEK